MVSRIQMDDIQHRLEVIKSQLSTADFQEWQLQELIEDCMRLRRSEPKGEFSDSLEFIESMLHLIQKNLISVRSLRVIRNNLCG